MNKEISEEAKQAILDASARKARERLTRDGATSDDALRRRVRAIAAERNIPPADYAELMHKRISTMAVMQFCKKHKVSYDWLLAGDLGGLRRMTQEAKAAEPPEISEGQRKEVASLLALFHPRCRQWRSASCRSCWRGGHL